MELREAYGRVKRRIEGPKEYRDSTGRPTESTNLYLQGLPETCLLYTSDAADD